jgi:hypothetical protein
VLVRRASFKSPSGPTSSGPTPAPRGREALAGMIDLASAGALGFIHWRFIRRRGADDLPGDGTRAQRLTSLLGPFSSVVREQIGTPGERIMGLRTVDRRTGRRVALWRTLVLALAQAGAVELRGRLAGARSIPDSEQQELRREAKALRERHRDDPEALQAAMMSLHSERKVTVDLRRSVGVVVGLSLLTWRLRNRLAPTLVVARRSADHSP